MRFSQISATSAVLFALYLPAFAGSGEIAPDRNPIILGQQVKLEWYFKGNKIAISGGRFGKGTDVTGRTSITDKPAKTTRYTFEVWYRAPKAEGESTADRTAPVHTQYSVVVEVVDPKALGFDLYRNPNGWAIQRFKDWKPDNVPLADPARNALVYFQREPDSVERLAVSILPVNEASCASLMKKVQADLPSHYDRVSVLTQSDLTFEQVPATLMTFEGMDQTHPGTKTRSLVLGFVRDGLGFVISARTNASNFEARRNLLQTMLKSFMLTARPANGSSPYGRDNPRIASARM